MSKKRDDLVEIRSSFFKEVQDMRHLGDYDAGARHTRETAEHLLKLIDLLLEHAR